jgi:hypothetical protein
MCDKAVFDALNAGMQTLYTTAVAGPATGADGTLQGTFVEPPVVFWKDDSCATYSGAHSTADTSILIDDTKEITPEVDPWRVMYVPLGIDYNLGGAEYLSGPRLHREPALGAHPVTLRRTGGFVWNSVQADVCMGRTTLELAGQEVRLTADCDKVMSDIYGADRSDSLFSGDIEGDLSCYIGASVLKSDPPRDRLPVVCFDATCAKKGYKSAEHIKNACSPPVCVKHIESIADEVSTNHPTIYCDGIHYTFPPKVPDSYVEPTPTAPPETSLTPDALRGLPAWEWAIVWVAILSAFVALALVVAFIKTAA